MKPAHSAQTPTGVTAPEGFRLTNGQNTRPREFVANCDAERDRRELLAARLRQALGGVSCAEIALKTGWSAETVRRYMQAKASPPATMLMVLAEQFSVNPEFILLGNGPARFEPGTKVPRPVSSTVIVDTLHFLIAQHRGDFAGGDSGDEGPEDARQPRSPPDPP